MYKCTRNPRNALNYWVFSLYILEKLRTNAVQMYKKRLIFADRSGSKRRFSVIFHIISYVLYTLSGHRLLGTGKQRFRPWQPGFDQAEAAGTATPNWIDSDGTVRSGSGRSRGGNSHHSELNRKATAATKVAWQSGRLHIILCCPKRLDITN